MSDPRLNLEISTAPFLHRGQSTPRIMWEVTASLALVVAASAYYFGVGALLIVLSATAGAAATEWAFRNRSSGTGPGTLRDGSAVLTGVLLALTLPPSIPLWMAFLGGVAAIALGKVIWGGLGQNLFNPALVGRAFLQAAFPSSLTTWTAPVERFFQLQPTNLAPPFAKAAVDVTTAATPLGLAKFQNESTEIGQLLLGNISGSLGETAGIVLIACGLWLGIRKVFDWRLPVATLLAVAVGAAVMHLARPEQFQGPLFMLGSGGLLFGAVFMVTDPVTSPLTKRGSWIFGIGVGLLVVLIRLFGGLPEGVQYSILLMNSVTPLINRFTQPRQFGG